MLAAPKHGWSTISIGDWSDRCSYLDDVPLILLTTLLRCFESVDGRYFVPSVCTFDAEGYDYLIVFDRYEVHIISTDTDEDIPKYHFVKCNIVTLAKELVANIEDNLDAWTEWLSYEPNTEESLSRRKSTIKFYCDYLGEKIWKFENR